MLHTFDQIGVLLRVLHAGVVAQKLLGEDCPMLTIPSPGIIPIAKIGAGTEVFNISGSVKVTIELQ
jgi:hypothetical protein